MKPRDRHGPALLAAALTAASTAARADPPPPARCMPSPPAHALALGVTGSVARLAAARDGERVVVVARVLPSPHASERATRIVVGEVGPDGGWAVAPREVARVHGRVDGLLEVAAREGERRVLFEAGGALRSVVLGAEGAGDVAEDVRRPSRGLAPVPLVARSEAGFTLVWRRAEAVVVQSLSMGAGAASAGATVRLPRRTRAYAAAAGPGGETALVVETSARRYYVAIVGADGRLAWPGNAPAGCERGRCPAVSLVSAPGGYVAAWRNRPAHDGLSVPGAWALDARGHVRGRAATTFIPMARGVVIAGPRGQALALQLGRPIVLRGGERPIAVPTAGEAGGERPVQACAWVEGDAIEVVSATRSGRVVVARVRCGSGSAEVGRPGQPREGRGNLLSE